MVLEGTLVLVTLLGCGPEWEMAPVELPPGPNLKTPSPTAAEPYEIVVISHVSWSPDGSLAHYRLRYQNRARDKKVGKLVAGFFVDVATGETLASYLVEEQGFRCPSLEPLRKRSKPKAWGEALLKKVGFVDAGKKRTWHPKGAGRLKLFGVKSRVGWVAAWRLKPWFAWRWQAFRRSIKAGEKLDPWIELRFRPKGKRKWQTLHRHRPYLDYHFSLGHRHTWQLARNREADTPARTICETGDLQEPKCKKELAKRGLGFADEYPFTGQIWTYWNKTGDGIIAFWDDRQLLGVDTDKAFVTYRSHVTVHSLVKRASSTLVPRDPPPTQPVMKPAVTMKAAPMPALAAAMPATMDAKTKPPKANKKGCGCQSTDRTAHPGVLLGLALLLLLRYRRR